MPDPHVPSDAGLSRLRVLVVEDELLLAMDYEEILQGAGFTVLGPFARQAGALSLLERERPDAALLDLNLAGESSTRVAEALAELGVPFIVVSGYGEQTAREPSVADAPRLEKPVSAQALVQAITSVARKG
jgi:CheY-like chemotaxis protein